RTAISYWAAGSPLIAAARKRSLPIALGSRSDTVGEAGADPAAGRTVAVAGGSSGAGKFVGGSPVARLGIPGRSTPAFGNAIGPGIGRCPDERPAGAAGTSNWSWSRGIGSSNGDRGAGAGAEGSPGA